MSTSSDKRLSYAFDLAGPPGQLDQALTIKVSGRRVLAPTLQFTPMDAVGVPVAGVTVRSAYGSDRGQLAVMPRGDNIDLLYFQGSGRSRVADVQVRTTAVHELAWKKHPTPQAIQMDARGNPIRPGYGFDHVRVVNASRRPMHIRAVVLVLEATNRPPQGALEVLPLAADRVTVPPRESAKLDPPPDVQQVVAENAGRHFLSVKAFPAAY